MEDSIALTRDSGGSLGAELIIMWHGTTTQMKCISYRDQESVSQLSMLPQNKACKNIIIMNIRNKSSCK
jgi:hypothetical protein